MHASAATRIAGKNAIECLSHPADEIDLLWILDTDIHAANGENMRKNSIKKSFISKRL